MLLGKRIYLSVLFILGTYGASCFDTVQLLISLPDWKWIPLWKCQIFMIVVGSWYISIICIWNGFLLYRKCPVNTHCWCYPSDYGWTSACLFTYCYINSVDLVLLKCLWWQKKCKQNIITLESYLAAVYKT